MDVKEDSVIGDSERTISQVYKEKKGKRSVFTAETSQRFFAFKKS